MTLEDSKRKLGLMYGLSSIWLVRFKDENCSKQWVSFFTLDENILPDRIISEHHDHEGFDMHVVNIQASALSQENKK